MIDSITVLAQMTDGGDALTSPGGIVVVGFLFVVAVLAFLAAVTSLMGAWFTRKAGRDAAKAAAAAQAAADALSDSALTDSNAPSDAEAEDPAFVAVIAAAVHTMVGDRPHRIVSIRSAGPGWAQEGRRQIFSSHRVR